MSYDCGGYQAPLSPLNNCYTPVYPSSGRLACLPAPAPAPCHDDFNISNQIYSTNGDGMNIGHSSTYFNGAGNQLYSRYNPKEWELSNFTKYGLSDKERGVAERIRTDVFQTIKVADAQTKERQAQNTLKLAKRRDDIAFWKNELNCEMKKMSNEIDNLTEHCRVLHKAYQDTKQPLAISQKCLEARENRQGIDRVADDVESSLTKEVATIKKCQAKMRKLIEKVHIQLKMNKAALEACQADACDKVHAQGLDDMVHQLHPSSNGLAIYPGVENQDETITNPISWMRFTQENICRSQKQREVSEKIRGYIDSLLRICANHMWCQFNNVNNNLQARVNEMQEARNKLQAHLQKVVCEIAQVQRSVGMIKSAINNQCTALKLAMTRLKERRCRINVELCHDPPMKGLIAEVREIHDSIKKLEKKLCCAEQIISRLQKAKTTLEKDIALKEHSIQIDIMDCIGIRKNMALDPKVAPIFNMPLYNSC